MGAEGGGRREDGLDVVGGDGVSGGGGGVGSESEGVEVGGGGGVGGEGEEEGVVGRLRRRGGGEI